MTEQRRDINRDTTDSVARIWQIYADQIGLPEARPTATSEPLPRQSEVLAPPGPRRRLMPHSRRHVLTAVAAVMVAVTAGIALRSQVSTSRDTANGPVPKAASASVDRSDTTVRHSEPGNPAGDGLQAVASGAPAPSDTVDSLRGQRTTDAVVSPPTNAASTTGADRLGTTQPRPAPVANTKQGSTTAVYRINFDFASDRVNNESRRILDKIVIAMTANPDWGLSLEGHTDGHGTHEYNRALSARRAHAAKAYLESAGIAPQRLSAVGFGASHPVAPNDGPLTFLNRRVEVHRR